MRTPEDVLLSKDDAILTAASRLVEGFAENYGVDEWKGSFALWHGWALRFAFAAGVLYGRANPEGGDLQSGAKEEQV